MADPYEKFDKYRSALGRLKDLGFFGAFGQGYVTPMHTVKCFKDGSNAVYETYDNVGLTPIMLFDALTSELWVTSFMAGVQPIEFVKMYCKVDPETLDIRSCSEPALKEKLHKKEFADAFRKSNNMDV